MDKHEKRWTAAAIICIALTGIAALLTALLRRPGAPPEIIVYTAPVTDVTAVRQQTETVTKNQTETASRTEPVTVTTEITTAEINRNLNTADADDLKRVPGIGDRLAEEITRFRDARGGFQRRAELLEIPGIGAVLAARIMEKFEIPDELPPETAPPETTVRTEITVIPETTVTEKTEPQAHLFFDINTVTNDELLQIPEMTEEMAEAALTFREKIGAFRSVYELAAVQGFSGEYVAHTCWDYLYAEGDAVTRPRSWEMQNEMRSEKAKNEK